MPLSFTFTARKLLAFGELLTSPAFNLATFLTGSLTGAASTSQIEDAAVTSAKTKAGPHFYAANNGSAVNDYRVTTNASLADGTVTDGTILFFEVASATNTGASTFKADTMTARSLVKRFNQPVIAGDLRLGQKAAVMWDADTTTWQLLSPDGNGADRYATTAGSDGLAYTATFAPTIKALTDGVMVRVKWNVTNTGAVTFAPDGLTAKAVRKLNDAALIAGDVLANQVSWLTYDLTLDHWLLVSPVVINTPATVVGLSRGLLAYNNASQPTFKADIAADDIVLKNAGGLSYLASAVAVTVNLTASGANGLDTGAEANSTWYYLWVIYDGTTVAGLLSTSATAPTMPTGYTYKALVGAVYNGSGGDFATFYQAGREVFITAGVAGTGLVATTYTSLSLAAIVPPIARTAQGYVATQINQNWSCHVAGDSSGTGETFVSAYPCSITVDTFYGAFPWRTGLKTAQAVYYKFNSNVITGGVTIAVTGYTL